MPSGYTQKLNKGPQSFAEFVIGCAHAFIVDMRDVRIGDPLPDPGEPKHEIARVEEARARLERATARTEAQWRHARDQAHADEQNSREAWRANNDAVAARYVEMIQRVEQWEPPTEGHLGLRDFMLKQLRESLTFDCEGMDDYIRPLPSNPDEWASVHAYAGRELQRAAQSLADAHEALAKARARDERNRTWAQALLDSIKEES